MNTIFEYEVELKVVHRQTHEVSLVKRQEFAYNVTDGLLQAIHNQNAENGLGLTDIVPMHIGPPSAAVRVVANETAMLIEQALKRIAHLAEKPA